MKTQKQFIVVALSVVLGIFVASCGSEVRHAQPSQFAPVEAFYVGMQTEKDNNPTRVKRLIERGGVYGIVGMITKIKDAKIQFHIQEKDLERDQYVECEFPSERNVWQFNKGQEVKVSGNLNKVNSKIELKNCQWWE